MMRILPLKVGRIHFVGIGGIGMSGIAEVLHALGYQVSGTDIGAGANVQRLRDLGIAVHTGHDATHVEDAGAVVVSSAIKSENPEVSEARSRRIPVVQRAEMLGELMRLRESIAIAGTHGKTTTTSLVAAILDTAGMDPTVINGGIINAYGTNARLGSGEWLVAEADESDGSFTKLPVTVGVVTNIDPEHMEHYGSFDTLRAAFDQFVSQVPFYGFSAVCIDHPEVQALVGRISDRRLITYGFSPQADIGATEPVLSARGSHFDVILRDRDGEESRIENVYLAMPGRHNAQNALAGIVIARQLGIADETIRRALADFSGVKRRFTITGEVNGVTIVDDYGHHPVEIEAVLHTARAACQGQLIAVMQPHRYSRLHDLFRDFCTCFNAADHVLITPVFAAGETPIEGADQESLITGIQSHGHRAVSRASGPEDIAAFLKETAKPGDMCVCLGAGNITAWAHALPALLDSPSKGLVA